MNQYVSRAGDKLAYALNHFDISVAGKVCADFGASTGGFTDCLIKSGAKKVYSVDTAYGELAWNLRNDPNVVVMERTNAMHATLPQKADLITVDVSWTKQKNILPNALKNLKESGKIISLVKPHYEAPEQYLKHGLLDQDKLDTVLEKVEKDAKNVGLEIVGVIKSPLVGAKGGNSEFLMYLRKYDHP